MFVAYLENAEEDFLMAKVKTEYEIERLFIERLCELGYEYVELKSYGDVLKNFKERLEVLNADKIREKKGKPVLSDSEFSRVLTRVENHTVYESAKILREQYVLGLDDGQTVYIEFLSNDIKRNQFQVTHQITMDPQHKDDVRYKNRYDVTVLLNGLPLVQIELKRPGVELSEAVNQINRYRLFSFKGLFRFIQIFVVSNSSQTKYFANCNEMCNGQYNPILKSLTFFWTDEKNERVNRLFDFTAHFFNQAFLTDLLNKYMVVYRGEPILMVMRPYQIYQVKAIMQRVLVENRNGFVQSTTGSGKTLTSFKAASLLRDTPQIDKVFFLIDRKDLDDQTVDEYNAFEPDCVDQTDNVRTLIRQLKDSDAKMVVTTIQKLAAALRRERYQEILEPYRTRKCVFIIDECHRSQFGKMHGDIKRHFKNANYIGFTGTPIFEENRGADGRTTADIFSSGTINPCLHQYLIKEAIADGNVLRFSVEFNRTIRDRDDEARFNDPVYCRKNGIDVLKLYHDPARIANITQHVLDHYEQHTRPAGTDCYTAIFAVDRITTLMAYYDCFKERNDKGLRIAAIFTYQANEELDEGTDEYSRMVLEGYMEDYNGQFGTSFSLETFDSYRKDIAKRLRQKAAPQIDILLVVDMFLTGFDAKSLNTLYLDKSLVWHNLLQAYSRTNRVYKKTKQFGQIITYRDIKKVQDDALRLFSGDGNPSEYLLRDYGHYVEKYFKAVKQLRAVAETADDAGRLQSEEEQKMFVLTFRGLSGILTTLKTFSAFCWSHIADALDEEEYFDYKSWYLEYYDRNKNDRKSEGVLIDVDFEIELIRTDKINVVYILNLLRNVERTDEEAMRRSVDLILREIERSDNESLRLKSPVLKEFIETRFFDLSPEDNLRSAYDAFEAEVMEREIKDFSEVNGLEVQVVSSILYEYQFSKTISREQIRIQLEKYGFGIIKMSEYCDRLMEFTMKISEKFASEGV